MHSRGAHPPLGAPRRPDVTPITGPSGGSARLVLGCRVSQQRLLCRSHEAEEGCRSQLPMFTRSAQDSVYLPGR